MSTLENPFHPPLKGSGETDTERDIELVKKLLGDEDAALLASVREGKEKNTPSTTPSNIMTDEEREMLVKAEKREQEQTWDRERYVEWADSVGRDEQWVDERFVFNGDGTVETTGHLYLGDRTSIPSFPPNLTIVRGDLDLSNLISADGLIFPRSIVRDLCLHNLTFAKKAIWPTRIGGNLIIRGKFVLQAKGLKSSGVLRGAIKYSAVY